MHSKTFHDLCKKTIALALALCSVFFLLPPNRIEAGSSNLEPPTLIQYDEKSLEPKSIIFQRGVFRVEKNGDRIALLCIPVTGVWRRVGSLEMCNNPPPEHQREIAQWVPNRTVLGVRNLGITTEDWDRIHKAGYTTAPINAFKRISEAFSIAIGDYDVRWRFDSSKLPGDIKIAIPGSGIHVHFGGLFSQENKLRPFDSDSSGLQIEARLAVPIFKHTGNAHSGITLAIDLEVPTLAGSKEGIPLIVSLLHQIPQSRENLASDGRVRFISTFLRSGTRYVTAVENVTHTSYWAGMESFGLRLTRDNLKKIVEDLNMRDRAVIFDDKQLENVAVTGVTLRNESRMLEEGDIAIEVAIDYLNVSKTR